MIELERTFLAKIIPTGLENCKHKEVMDVYLPKEAEHPVLRLRKNGDSYEMTKKEPVSGTDSSKLTEHTIPLTKQEFDALRKIKGKEVRKIRYYYEYEGRTAEVDVFQDKLKGLVLIDFEFSMEEEKEHFKMPDFCLTEVTQEELFAGGMLCGKKYKDIKQALSGLKYKKIIF